MRSTIFCGPRRADAADFQGKHTTKRSAISRPPWSRSAMLSMRRPIWPRALAVRVLDELSDLSKRDLSARERLVEQALAMSPEQRAGALRQGAGAARAVAVQRGHSRIRDCDRSRPQPSACLRPCRMVQISDRLARRRAPLFRAGYPAQPARAGDCPLVRADGGHPAADLAYRRGDRKAGKGRQRKYPAAVCSCLARRRLCAEGRYRTGAGWSSPRRKRWARPMRASPRVEKSIWFDNPKIRALAEATYFAGLRRAGIAEE